MVSWNGDLGVGMGGLRVELEGFEDTINFGILKAVIRCFMFRG